MKPEDLEKNGTFCLYPFIQMSTIPAGFVRPCCFSGSFIQKDATQAEENDEASGKRFNVAEDSLAEVWNSPHLKKIRKLMLNGERVLGCRQCYEEEAASAPSMRRRSLEEWGDRPEIWKSVERAAANDCVVDEPPRFLELKPGSLCNLKCRMCHQFDSTSVAKEITEISIKLRDVRKTSQSRLVEDFDFNFEPGFDISKMPDWSAMPALWAEVEGLLPNLEQLSFAGGEPTLLEEVHSLLKKCVETGHSKHIRVFLSSNFTRIRDDLLEYANHFKLFEFIGSIDGTGAVQEYIRFPSRWSEVKKNFELATRKTIPGRSKSLINLTLQAYNVLSFTDVLDWVETLDGEPEFVHHPYNINVLFYPRYLSIDYLPLELRPLAIERIEAYSKRTRFFARFPGFSGKVDHVINRLREPLPHDYETRVREFWRFTKILDEHRDQKLQDAVPELYRALESEARRLGVDTRASIFGGVEAG